MTPIGDTVGDVAFLSRSWRRRYGPAADRRLLRKLCRSRCDRRIGGEGDCGRGVGGREVGGPSNRTGDDVVDLHGLLAGGGVAGVGGGSFGGGVAAVVSVVDTIVEEGFDTSFGTQKPVQWSPQSWHRQEGKASHASPSLERLLAAGLEHALVVAVRDAARAPMHNEEDKVSHGRLAKKELD